MERHHVSRRTFLKGMGAVATAAAALPLLPMASAGAEPRIIPAGKRLMRFAHVTDLHFTNRRQNRYPTSHYHVRQAVADLNTQDLDFVLFTGDMFHFPEDMGTEMEALTDALKGLRVPYYCTIGNHDAEGDRVKARKTFLKAGLGDQGLAYGDDYYTFAPIDGLRFVVLDSTDIDGDAYHAWSGHMGDRQFAWLERTLAKHREETIFVAIHHPPLAPYPFLEKLRFEAPAAGRLEALLARYDNVQLMFAGHFHFGGRNRFANAELLLGPSLVEHPHPYRVVEVARLGREGQGVVSYEWKSLRLHGDEDEACAYGTAGLRSFGLLSLSYQRNGLVDLALSS